MRYCKTTDEDRDDVDADRYEAIQKEKAKVEFSAFLGRQGEDRLEPMWLVLGEVLTTRYLTKQEMYDLAWEAMENRTFNDE